MTTEIRIGLSVTSSDPLVVARVSEQFARAAAGLAMDGEQCIVSIGPEFSFAMDDQDEAM